MNEMPPLPRLNGDPEPGELDDYATSPHKPDARILAQAKGEAEIPTAPPPPSAEAPEARAESSTRPGESPPLPRRQPDG
jgi:hypothetical protein